MRRVGHCAWKRTAASHKAGKHRLVAVSGELNGDGKEHHAEKGDLGEGSGKKALRIVPLYGGGDGMPSE